jgi:hypothetical protein
VVGEEENEVVEEGAIMPEVHEVEENIHQEEEEITRGNEVNTQEKEANMKGEEVNTLEEVHNTDHQTNVKKLKTEHLLKRAPKKVKKGKRRGLTLLQRSQISRDTHLQLENFLRCLSTMSP